MVILSLIFADEFLDWRVIVVDEDEEKQKNLVLVIHRYIQRSCNLMAEIISEILGIKKLTEMTIITNEGVLEGPNGKILDLWDQIENNN